MGISLSLYTKEKKIPGDIYPNQFMFWRERERESVTDEHAHLVVVVVGQLT
jgi:hypothetical protein